MRRRHLVLCAGACAVLAVAPPAAAQGRGAARARAAGPTRLTISASGGIQAAVADLSDHFTFAKDQETETVDVDYPMKPGVLGDVGAAYRFSRRAGVGVAVSRVSGTGTAEIDASVPHPFFFGTPRTVSGTQSNITHNETSVHLQLRYAMYASRRLEAVVAAGPTWSSVEQEVVSGVKVNESYPYDTATFGGAITRRSKASAAGFNAGLDIAWMFQRSLGIGGLIRFTRAEVDVDVSDGRGIAMKAGGVQAGVGLRLAF